MNKIHAKVVTMHAKAVKMRVKNNELKKITIKQTMLSPAMSPVESPSVATTYFFALRAPPSPRGFWGDNDARLKMGGLFYSRKITTIILGSRHLVLRSLGTYWSTRVLGKGTCCARRRRITPNAPYLR